MNRSHAERVTLKVREVMGARQKSALKLAEETGQHRGYIHRRVSGDVPWSVEDLTLIAPALGVTAGELFAGSDVAPAPTPAVPGSAVAS